MKEITAQTKRPLEVRERHHDFSESIPKYFDSGNVVLTAEWNALALIIPLGELFFIRSVQRMAARSKDSGLKSQINGFIGQDFFIFRKAFHMLLKWEGHSRAEIREERKRARRIRLPLCSWTFPHLWDFLRPSFHPNDLDDGGLSKKIFAEQAARAGAMEANGRVP